MPRTSEIFHGKEPLVSWWGWDTHIVRGEHDLTCTPKPGKQFTSRTPRCLIGLEGNIYICQIKSHHLVIAWKLDAIFRTLYPKKAFVTRLFRYGCKEKVSTWLIQSMHEGAMTSGINPLPSLNSYHIVIWNRLPKNQLPTDPPNYENMAQGHGFRDICAISITVRMVLGACRKLNFWRFVLKVPNISRLINKCLEIPHLHSPTQHQICCQSSTKSAQFIACRCYRHDFSSAVFAYIDQHQGWANAAQEHVAAINQNLGVAWIHFQSSVFFGCSSISEKRNFQSHLYTMCWRIDEPYPV